MEATDDAEHSDLEQWDSFITDRLRAKRRRKALQLPLKIQRSDEVREFPVWTTSKSRVFCAF